MFKQITSYCVAKGNPFDCYEDAEKAYLKHKERVARRKTKTPFHKVYHRLVKEHFRFKEHYKYYELYDYEFIDVLNFLKANHYYGKQVFDCSGTDSPDLVYSKDGVRVYFEGNYDYIEVFGLRPCDFYVLKKAYSRCFEKICS